MMTSYYIVTPRGTIERTGTVQPNSLPTDLAPGEQLFVGQADAWYNYWDGKQLQSYTPDQLKLRSQFPGPGYVWDASKMAWADNRVLADVKVAKLVAAQAERDRRAAIPVLVSGTTVPADHNALMRALLVVSMNPGLAAAQMQWADIKGNVQTFASAPAYRLFATSVGQAIAAQVAAADSWLWGIQSQISAATTLAAVDAIIW